MIAAPLIPVEVMPTSLSTTPRRESSSSGVSVKGASTGRPPSLRASSRASRRPPILIAEAPLAGLEGAAAAFVLDALVQVTEGRRAIFSVTRIDPASPEGRLARAASHVIVLAGGEIALEGTPAELFSGVRVYTLTVHRNAEPFRAELALRGIPLRGGPHRFSVELAVGGSTRDIVAAAQAARASLVEMVPLIG